MDHAKNPHVLTFNAIQNHVIAYGKTPRAGSKLFVTSTAHIRMVGKEEKPLGERINKAVSRLDGAAFSRDVVPDVVKINLGLP